MANDRNMINAFDDAIERLATGEDLENILQDYPDYADHLRDLLMISTRVAEVHNEDDSVTSAQSRGRDRLQQALKEKPKRAPYRRPKWYIATVAIASFVMLFGAGIFATATLNQANPGLDMTRTVIADANTTTEALIQATNFAGTSIALETTPLFINATATPLPTEPPSITPAGDVFAVTATQLIKDLTAQAEGTPIVLLTQSAQTERFDLTATALINQLTQDTVAIVTTTPLPEQAGIIPTSVASMVEVTATPELVSTGDFPFTLTAEAQQNVLSAQMTATNLANLFVASTATVISPIDAANPTATALVALSTPLPNATSGVDGGIKTTSMPEPLSTPTLIPLASRTAQPTSTAEPTMLVGTPVADGALILPATVVSIQPTALPALIPLTAGEIDDNEDWDTYLQYRRAFLFANLPVRDLPVRDIDVEGRQIITVIDENGQPVSGATVEVRVIGEQIVWQSQTYADGRTMFLPNLDSMTRNQNIYSVIATKDNVSGMTILDRTQSSEWIVTLPTVIDREENKLDVLFLIDTTSSMGDEIAQLQNNILHISSEVDAFADNVNVRYGLVLYREHDNFEYLTRRHDFTSNVNEFQMHLNAVTANSGDNNTDWDEALNVGLDEALQQMPWRDDDTIKLIFLVADARPHFDHPLEPVTYDQSILNALSRGIKIHPIASSGLEQAGEYIFRQIAQVTMGHFIFLTYDDGVAGTSGDDRPEFNVGEPESDDPIGGYTVNQLSDIVLRLIQDELAVGQVNRP